MIHFLKYNAIGVLNTGITLAVVYGLHQRLGASIEWSNLAGYVLGGLNSFLLNRGWNFRSRNHVHGDAGRFLLVFTGCYVLNLAVLESVGWLLVQGSFLPRLWAQTQEWLRPGFVAHVAANVAYVLASFTLLKQYVFRNRMEASPEGAEKAGC